MKEKIYLYLLAFITVIFLFFYKYQSSVFKQQQEDVYALERVVEKLEEEKKFSLRNWQKQLISLWRKTKVH